MASGLKAQLGWADETGYGTPSTVTVFGRVKNYTPSRTATRPTGEGITAGRPLLYAGHLVETSEAATLTFEMDLQDRSMGKLYRAMFGSFATPSAITGGAYIQTHSLQADTTQSVTFQGGLPEGGTSTTVRPITIAGGVPTQVDISCNVTEIANSSWQIDGREYLTTVSLASASYVDTVPFHGKQLGVRIGTYGSESAVTGITGVQLSIARPRDVDKRFANSGGKKGFPGMNGPIAITGTITADYLDTTSFQARWLSLEKFSLVVEFIDTASGVIGTSSVYKTWRLTLPSCYLVDNAGQAVPGREVLSNGWAFEARDDETNPAAVLEIINTESSI